MLNEMMIGRFKCPVCGRVFFGPLLRYWCPYCGVSAENDTPVISEVGTRITTRDEDGIACYTGIHSIRDRTYAPELSVTAMMEVLERLCQLEEQQEEEEDNG